MAHSAEAVAILDLIIEVLKLAPKVQHQGDCLTQDLGLTSSRWGFLMHVAQSDGQLTVADIARRMKLKRQTVQRFAVGIEQTGLITFTENPDHKRAKLLCVTQKGKRALATLEKRELKWAETVIADLSDRDIRKATKVLAAFRLNIAPEC